MRFFGRWLCLKCHIFVPTIRRSCEEFGSWILSFLFLFFKLHVRPCLFDPAHIIISRLHGAHASWIDPSIEGTILYASQSSAVLYAIPFAAKSFGRRLTSWPDRTREGKAFLCCVAVGCTGLQSMRGPHGQVAKSTMWICWRQSIPAGHPWPCPL